jgi:hypothetical protein
VAAALLVLAGGRGAEAGGLHRFSHADAMVPVLVSLQRWTPFYWDQERYGMFVPLVALPIRDPLWNLLAQRFLLALAGLGAVVLLGRHVLAGRDWPLAGALAAALLLAAAPGPWLFELLADQPYGLSFGLALAGLAVAEPDVRGRRPAGRVALGAALVLAAHWVNAGAGLLLVPLAGARALVDRAERDLAGPVAEPPGGAGRPGDPRQVPYATGIRDRLLVDAGLLALGVLAGQVAIRLHPRLTGRPLELALGFLPVDGWPRAWATFAAGAWRSGRGWLAALAAVSAAGVALIAAVPRLRPTLRRALVRAGALAGAGVAYGLLTGSLGWVAQNGFHWRYLVPSVLLLHVAAVSLLAEPLARSRRLGLPVGAISLAAPALAALVAWGPPSLARVRGALDRTCGALTPRVLALRCDAVAGDYWTVWPAVWHAAWARARGEGPAGGPVVTYGLTHRARPTLPLWARPGARVCVPEGQEAIARRWIEDHGLAAAGLALVPMRTAGPVASPW